MVGRPLRKVTCDAARKYDGNPCQAKALQNGRCKYHGGMSTGAKTLDGKIKAYSEKNDVLTTKMIKSFKGLDNK